MAFSGPQWIALILSFVASYYVYRHVQNKVEREAIQIENVIYPEKSGEGIRTRERLGPNSRGEVARESDGGELQRAEVKQELGTQTGRPNIRPEDIVDNSPRTESNNRTVEVSDEATKVNDRPNEIKHRAKSNTKRKIKLVIRKD